MKDKFKEFAAEIARKTSKYLRRNLGRVKEIGYKEEIINLVTNVDRKVEEIVIKTLQKYFPDDGFLSEEFGEKKGKNNRKWIIDPLDGTTNYAHGFPFYAVSIAVLEDLRPIFGLVFDPERNELFMAAKSKGAYCNKKKIKVSNICNLNESLLATGFSYKIRKAKDDNVGHFKDFLRVSQAVRRAGSASLDLCYVACGRFDGFWELDLNPWDTAAGWLIIKEAGGKVTAFNSSKYNPFLKEILASNGKIHREMSRILTKQNSKNPRLNTV